MDNQFMKLEKVVRQKSLPNMLIDRETNIKQSILYTKTPSSDQLDIIKRVNDKKVEVKIVN